MTPFMFSTGIENSIPTIDGGRRRVDEMEKCGHYERWREDFALLDELGISYLRYGPPLYRTFLGPGRYDWEFADLTFGRLKAQNVIPIADLCHFGVPDWIGNFQNPDFPELFAGYARDFARRFPWVQLYTPVNEMYVCATFSAAYGWWNEQMTTDTSFVTALKHIVKANILAMCEILKERPDAIFVQSESTQQFHAEDAESSEAADFLNARRFLSLDLNYAHPVDSRMYRFLMDGGMTEDEYDFFMGHDMKQHCIMGNDYYKRNEHWASRDRSTAPSGEVFGYCEITREYHRRYRLPIMYTETNTAAGPDGDEAVHWLRKQWMSVLRIRDSGLPVVGFTWYSLTDQVDWDVSLREDNGTVDPLGLYDLDRKPRAVGKAYRQLISDWRNVLPARSRCLVVPIVPPNAMGADPAGQRQDGHPSGAPC